MIVAKYSTQKTKQGTIWRKIVKTERSVLPRFLDTPNSMCTSWA